MDITAVDNPLRASRPLTTQTAQGSAWAECVAVRLTCSMRCKLQKVSLPASVKLEAAWSAAQPRQRALEDSIDLPPISTLLIVSRVEVYRCIWRHLLELRDELGDNRCALLWIIAVSSQQQLRLLHMY